MSNFHSGVGAPYNFYQTASAAIRNSLNVRLAHEEYKALCEKREQMIERVAHNALGENADIDFVRSMITRKFNLNEERAFTATLKRRAQLAQRYGAPVSIFRDVSIDAPLADEIALAESYKSTQPAADGLEELTRDLKPEANKTDAIQYCARLVCHVWNLGANRGLRKCMDYVFQIAAKGVSIFGACKRARDLVNMWNISLGTIRTTAGKIHSKQGGSKHKKRDGMERPETMQQAAKKSRAAERAEMEAERKPRRTGRR